MDLPFINRLSTRQAVTAVTVALVLGIVFSFIQIGIDYLKEREEVRAELQHITRAFYQPSAYAAFNFGASLASQVVEGIFEFRPIYSAIIMDDGGNVFASRTRSLVDGPMRWLAEFMFGSLCEIRTPLYGSAHNVYVGVLELKMDPLVITERFLFRGTVTVLSGFLRNLLMASVLSVVFFYMLSRPLNNIIKKVVLLNTETLDTHDLFEVRSGKKDELDLLVASIQGFVLRIIAYRQHKASSIEKIQSQAELLTMTEELTCTGSWWLAPEGGVGAFSKNECRILGFPETVEATMSLYLSGVHVDDRKEVDAKIHVLMASNESQLRHEYRFQRGDGTERNILATVRVIRDEKSVVVRLVGADQDITESKKIEQALNRTQRLNAVGKMAGGLAHDFNNLLGIIIGNLGLLNTLLDETDDRRKRVDASLRAAKRGEDLVSKLLSFSRDDFRLLKATNVNNVIVQFEDLIERSVPQNIVVTFDLNEDLWACKLDKGDLGDALYNLLNNACDAMQGGGKITITTENVYLREGLYQKDLDTIVSEYVMVEVKDTGIGMSEATQERLFEPFYTTKPAGKGTGLGLSMVYGFVQRSSGFVDVHSIELNSVEAVTLSRRDASRNTVSGEEVFQQGETGTSIQLYFPRCVETPEVDLPSIGKEGLDGSGRVLLIDDEDDLLSASRVILETAGYEVVTLAEASRVELTLKIAGPFDLVVSDVVMPGEISGYDIDTLIKKNHPETKCILTSGYDKRIQLWAEQEGCEFLSKPYQRSDLLEKVKMIISEGKARLLE